MLLPYSKSSDKPDINARQFLSYVADWDDSLWFLVLYGLLELSYGQLNFDRAELDTHCEFFDYEN